jgi:excinuclease ABC subunit C
MPVENPSSLTEDLAPESNDKRAPQWLRQEPPESPGVYLFKDGSGRIIYVGKAKNLRRRVLAYFRKPQDLSQKTAWMMRRARGLDFIMTSSEKEAFILESTLIKKHLPRYNIILRDDKQYPCLRLDPRESYPRLAIVRRIRKDGALYFGPFSSANSVRTTLKLIDRVFQLRKCRERELTPRPRPCLNQQMGRCLGPCALDVPKEHYREIVDQVILFLEGRNRELMTQLRGRMEEASEALDFERAAGIRDRIRAVERTIERQVVVSPRMEDQDVIGLVRDGRLHQVVILFVRRGAMVGSRDYLFRKDEDQPGEVLEAFLKQFYLREPLIPPEILVSERLEDGRAIAAWLSDAAGKRVSILSPQRGEKRRLVEMALANAGNLIESRSKARDVDLMERVQAVLGLRRRPTIIEGIDISNLGGGMAVGTVVSFMEGLPQKAGYRNYRIRTVAGADDYAMMTELAVRRLRQGGLPDLVLVDGGKGHLHAVQKVLQASVEQDPPETVAIAKPEETRGETLDKIYVPGRKDPVALAPDDPVRLLMMRIRDEAHRRAVSFHRDLRRKALTRSVLDGIPGVGSRRKKILLRHFEKMEAVARASVEELASLPGIGLGLAETIQKRLREALGPALSPEGNPG